MMLSPRSVNFGKKKPIDDESLFLKNANLHHKSNQNELQNASPNFHPPNLLTKLSINSNPRTFSPNLTKSTPTHIQALIHHLSISLLLMNILYRNHKVKELSMA
jgi:hypothetical protein